MLLEELPKFIQKILTRPDLDRIYDALIFPGLKRVYGDTGESAVVSDEQLD